jgi:hypothetical protein
MKTIASPPSDGGEGDSQEIDAAPLNAIVRGIQVVS